MGSSNANSQASRSPARAAHVSVVARARALCGQDVGDEAEQLVHHLAGSCTFRGRLTRPVTLSTRSLERICGRGWITRGGRRLRAAQAVIEDLTRAGWLERESNHSAGRKSRTYFCPVRLVRTKPRFGAMADPGVIRPHASEHRDSSARSAAGRITRAGSRTSGAPDDMPRAGSARRGAGGYPDRRSPGHLDSAGVARPRREAGDQRRDVAGIRPGRAVSSRIDHLDQSADGDRARAAQPVTRAAVRRAIREFGARIRAGKPKRGLRRVEALLGLRARPREIVPRLFAEPVVVKAMLGLIKDKRVRPVAAQILLHLRSHGTISGRQINAFPGSNERIRVCAATSGTIAIGRAGSPDTRIHADTGILACEALQRAGVLCRLAGRCTAQGSDQSSIYGIHYEGVLALRMALGLGSIVEEVMVTTETGNVASERRMIACPNDVVTIEAQPGDTVMVMDGAERLHPRAIASMLLADGVTDNLLERVAADARGSAAALLSEIEEHGTVRVADSYAAAAEAMAPYVVQRQDCVYGLDFAAVRRLRSDLGLSAPQIMWDGTPMAEAYEAELDAILGKWASCRRHGTMSAGHARARAHYSIAEPKGSTEHLGRGLDNTSLQSREPSKRQRGSIRFQRGWSGFVSAIQARFVVRRSASEMETHAGTHGGTTATMMAEDRIATRWESARCAPADVAEALGEELRALAIVHRGMSSGVGDGSSPLYDLGDEQERPRIGGKIIDYTDCLSGQASCVRESAQLVLQVAVVKRGAMVSASARSTRVIGILTDLARPGVPRARDQTTAGLARDLDVRSECPHARRNGFVFAP